MGEAEYMRQIQLAAADDGVCLYRNNVGMCRDDKGRVVKFGLCKGSSDLIGYRPVTITEDMVGETIAVFTSVETKGPRTPVTPEQYNWLKAVRRAGGIARLLREGKDTW